MKKIIQILSVCAVIAAIIAILIFNKRTTAKKTRMAAGVSTAVAVRVAVAKDSTYSLGFSTAGILKALRDLQFVSDISGRVVNIYAGEGSYVKKGEVLLQLDNEMLLADLTSREAAYEGLKKDYERFKNAIEQGGVTDQQLDNIHTQVITAESQLIASRRRLADASVKSPITGTIYKRHVEVGSYLNPGTLLFDIIDDSQLKAICSVTGKQIPEIRKGQAVTLASEIFPGTDFTGKITFIGEKADRSLNFPVETTITGPEKGLKPGMFVTVLFEPETKKNGILVPRSAISGSVHGADVFVIENGIARRRNAIIGDISGEYVEVLQGLHPGDSVITGGLINVSDGSKVRSIRR